MVCAYLDPGGHEAGAACAWRGRWRARRVWLLAAVLAAAVASLLVVSTSAQAADCALADYAYTAACGPEFESPAWGDGGGWTSASQYSTIKLADITGNGQDELLARNSDGLEIWWFDTSLGQWRPAIGADGLPEVLKDFRDPLTTESPDSQGADPEVYSTIQTAQVLGNGSESIVAQFPDGTHTYDYVPPAGTKSINGGTWLREPISGPKGDLPPSYYLSMRVIGVQADVAAATLVFQNAYYVHSGNGTPGQGSWDPTGLPTWNPGGTEAQYYLDNRAAEWPVAGPGGQHLVPANVYRTAYGVQFQTYDPQSHICRYYVAGCLRVIPGWSSGELWTGYSEDQNVIGPFPQVESQLYGCYPVTFSCFGVFPSWYETMRVANDLRGPADKDGYVLGRVGDGGLHVYAYNGSSWDTSLPVLEALKASSKAATPPGTWSSIRTGDITGDGSTDVLAVVDGQLQAWELRPNGSGGWAWSQLPAAVPLNLGQAYETNASYYSTLQVGPVAEPGYPDGVIARGPFGIRTWFYCSGGASAVPGCASLQGKSGWASFLPQGTASYPRFSGGQAAAWTALNVLAHNPAHPLIDPTDATVRDVWTAPTPPTDKDLSTLSSGLALAANCSGETSVAPPTYTSCAPPAGTGGFTATDWTAVVNETLKEIYGADQALSWFAELDAIRQDAFLTNTATLPAIGSALQPLNGAAATPVSISPWAAGAAAIGIAGAAAGAINPVAGVFLAAASYILGMISSGTPALQAPPFYGTYADLQAKFATAAAQADNAVAVQLEEVLQSWPQTQLVTQLTASGGPWHRLDGTGLKSSMEEGLSLWAYQTLLPTLYDRYVITNCRGETEIIGNTDCFFTAWGPVDPATGLPLVHETNGAFTTLQAPPSGNWNNSAFGGPGTPCWTHALWRFNRCDYTSPPTSNGADGNALARQIWGPVSDTCNYNGDPLTAWKFGDCNLGVQARYSIGQAGDLYGWDFTTCAGDPIVSAPGGRGGGENPPQGQCTAPPSGSATPGPDGGLQLSADAGAPRGFDVRSATLVSGGLLEAAGQHAELAASSGAPLTTIHLSLGNGKPLANGGLKLGSPRGAPSATLVLGHNANGNPTLKFSLGRVPVAVPDACQELPASISMTTSPFSVSTTLELSNGRRTMAISLPTTWECLRNRRGVITEMRTIAPTTPAQRPGLRVSVHGPRSVIPGSTVSYFVDISNMRRGPLNRTISSLWNLMTRVSLIPGRTGQRALGRPVTLPTVIREFRELGRGRSKRLRILIHIPAALRNTHLQQVCVAALTGANAARSASAQSCATVTALQPPRVTG